MLFNGHPRNGYLKLTDRFKNGLNIRCSIFSRSMRHGICFRHRLAAHRGMPLYTPLVWDFSASLLSTVPERTERHPEIPAILGISRQWFADKVKAGQVLQHNFSVASDVSGDEVSRVSAKHRKPGRPRNSKTVAKCPWMPEWLAATR